MTESSDREGGPRLERSPSSSSGWSSYSDASYDEQLLRQEEDELNERAMRNQDLHRQAVQEEYARMELGFGSSRVVVVNKLEWERLCALCPANTSTRRRRRPPQEGQRRNGFLWRASVSPGPGHAHLRPSAHRTDRPSERASGCEDHKHVQVAADARKQWRRRTWGMSVLGLPMVPPASKIHQRWVLFDISLDALYSCLLLPISLALGTSTIRLTWAAVMDVLAGAGFIFSALMSLHIGFYITHNFRRRLIMDGWESFMYYMRSVRFIIDLLTVVQLLVQIAGLVSPSQAMEDATTVTRTIRLLRLFHFVVETFFAANRYDPNSTYWPRWIGRRTQYFLLMGFNSFVVTNFVGCVLLAGARVENPSLQNTWVDYNGFIDLSPASQWAAALYWGLTTVTTVGFGDITPSTEGERITMIFVQFLGVMMFASVMGSITTQLQRMNRASEEMETFRSKLEAISTWLTRMALPPEVVHRVRMFYLSMHDRQMNHHINWDFVRDLPAALRSEITNHSTAGLLDSLALFHGVDAATVRSLTAKLVPKSVAPGYDVCAEGTANDGIFILQEGSVVVVHHDTFQETVQAPAVLSETAVLAEIVQDWKLRPRGFQAVSPCTVWELSLQDMVPLLQGKPGMHARLLSMAKDSLLRSFGGFEHYADELTLLKTTVPELDRAVATLKKHNSLRMRSSLRKVASNNAVPAVTTEASAAPTGDAAVNPSSRQTTPQGEGEDTVGPLAGPGEREQTHEATSTAPENGAQGGGAGSREGSRHGKRLQKTPSTRIVGSPVRPQLERISAPQDPSSSSGPAPSRMGQLLRTATFKVSQAIDGKHGQRGHQGIGEGSVRGGMDRAWALEIAREVQELKAMVAKLIAASDSA